MLSNKKIKNFQPFTSRLYQRHSYVANLEACAAFLIKTPGSVSRRTGGVVNLNECGFRVLAIVYILRINYFIIESLGSTSLYITSFTEDCRVTNSATYSPAKLPSGLKAI